jgi:hypothetical protein
VLSLLPCRQIDVSRRRSGIKSRLQNDYPATQANAIYAYGWRRNKDDGPISTRNQCAPLIAKVRWSLSFFEGGYAACVVVMILSIGQ